MNDRQIADISVVAVTLLFVGLKLTGNIDWSYWYVLSPLWGVVALRWIVIFTNWSRK